MEDTEPNDATSVLSLQVTEEQREAIYHFFAYNDWDFREVATNNNETPSNENSEIESNGNFIIQQSQEADECPYCFCRPCITHEQNRQMWWEDENSDPHERNSFLRKEKYKRFWTNLFHREVWKDPRYLRRKRQALRRDRPRRKYVYHRRDLMPKCIIELVRTWFPNPPGQPYMGHMWD